MAKDSPPDAPPVPEVGENLVRDAVHEALLHAFKEHDVTSAGGLTVNSVSVITGERGVLGLDVSVQVDGRPVSSLWVVTVTGA